VPLSRVHAAARLLACAFVPFHAADALDSIVDMLDRMTQAVPSAELWFANDGTAVDFVRAQRP
jgi:hypothetical protein